jgi:DNA-binding LacI/PurR family transcriptional regulator
MNNPLFIEIAEKLKKRIRQEYSLHSENWNLPTLRKLAREYQTSPVTVKKSVDRLVAEKLLHSRRGIGIKVNRDAVMAEKMSLNIGVVFVDIFEISYGILGDIIKGITKVQQELGFRITFIPLPSEKDPEIQWRLLDEEITKGIDGVLLTTRLPLYIISRLRDNDVPFIWINNYIPHEKIPAVIIDKPHLYMLAAEYIKNNGFKNAGFVMPAASVEDRRLFKGICSSKGITPKEIGSYGGIATEERVHLKSYQEALNLFAEKDIPEVIVCGDSAVHFAFARAAAESNINIPEDLKLLTYVTNEEAYFHLPQPANVIVLPFEKCSEKSAYMLIKILEGEMPDPHIEYVDAKLITADTYKFRVLKKEGKYNEKKKGHYASV